MSTVILDASVAIALVTEEEGSEAAVKALWGREPLVPEAFWAEATNALTRKVRQRKILLDEALDAYRALGRLIEYSVDTRPLGAFAMSLALDLDHTVYDCLYLAAAIAHHAPLLTADRELHARATDAGLGEHVILVG